MLLVLLHLLIVVDAFSAEREIVILHDKTYTQFDPTHDWMGKLHQMVRDVQIRFPVLHISTATSLRAIDKNSRMRAVAGFITVARCQRGRTLAKVARKMYPDVPLLRIDTEYCNVADAVMLTWLKTDLSCFIHVFQEWVSSLLVVNDTILERHFPKFSTNSGNIGLSCDFRKKPSTHLVDTYHGKYRRNILNGQKIRLGTMQSPITVLTLNKSSGEVLKYGGLIFDHMEALASALNYKFTILVSPDFISGSKLPNGTWTSICGMAERQEIELTAMAFNLFYKTSEVIDWIYAAFDNPHIFVAPLPKVRNSWLASTYPYTSKVWLFIIGSFILLSAVSYYVDLISTKLVPGSVKLITWHSYFFFPLAVILNQGRSDVINHHSSRILLVAWCVFAVIFVNLYTSVLVGYLTLPQIEPVIRDFDDLAQSNEIRMVFVNNSPIANLFFDPYAYGNFAKIRDKSKNNPENFVNNRLEVFDKIALTGRHVVADSAAQTYAGLAQDYAKHGRCRHGLVNSVFYTVPSTYATPKGSPYWHFFYMGLARVVETGIWHKMNQKLKVSSPCVHTTTGVPASKKLGLADLISPFAFYAIGISIAIMILLLEVLSLKRNSVVRKF